MFLAHFFKIYKLKFFFCLGIIYNLFNVKLIGINSINFIVFL